MLSWKEIMGHLLYDREGLRGFLGFMPEGFLKERTQGGVGKRTKDPYPENHRQTAGRFRYDIATQGKLWYIVRQENHRAKAATLHLLGGVSSGI